MTFQQIMSNLAGRSSMLRVFDDFLQMSICALSLQQMEEEYLQIAKNYDQKELELFSHALGQLIIEADAGCTDDGGWKDLFGDFYMDNISNRQAGNLGQFFTPVHICQMMAKMITEEANQEITVNDPSCGSGRTLIAHCRSFPKNRFNTFYVAQDLDYTCVKMCVLNFVLFGMKGVVIHQNTLSNEIYRGYRIWMPETGMLISPLNKQQCISYLTSSKEETVIEEVAIPDTFINQPVQKVKIVKKTTNSNQLTLF